TGCGKTFLAETVARILDVPFFAADATQYSETGYVGSDVEEMFRGLLKAARSDPGQAAKGVIYIDEIDKIAASRDNGKHNSTRDVSGESVQEELLRAVEGGDHPLRQFDAKNVLFIAGGAFSKMAPKTGQSDQTTAIGFGRCQNQALKAGKTFKPSQSDFVDYGMLPELMGRFQVRLALENLDKDSLRLILTEPKNSIISQYQYLFKANGITLKFEDRVLDIIAERAESMKTGARGLKSAVEEILNPLMFQHFGKGAEKRDLVISPAML
ncbi:MAG: AAA family ATPase, partial [bacterium]|nr:AAA family ATPase [bacterium]